MIVDTGVFGARLTPRGRSLASAYRPLLEGRPAIIAFITVAELPVRGQPGGLGPRKACPAGPRTGPGGHGVAGPNLTETYVTVRTWCAKTGHGLGGKDHEADRWVGCSAPRCRVSSRTN